MTPRRVAHLVLLAVLLTLFSGLVPATAVAGEDGPTDPVPTDPPPTDPCDPDIACPEFFPSVVAVAPVRSGRRAVLRADLVPPTTEDLPASFSIVVVRSDGLSRTRTVDATTQRHRLVTPRMRQPGRWYVIATVAVESDTGVPGASATTSVRVLPHR